MAHQFGEFEVVLINNQKELPPAAVRGWNETGEVYELRLPDGQTINVPEEKLTTTGLFETPFRFNELVEIHPHYRQDESEQEKQESVVLEGQRGIISGIASNDEIGIWAFSVAVQNGKCWYLEESELKSLGQIIPDEELYGEPDDTEWVRLHYNPVTKETTVIAGDPSFMHRGPTPLQIDLDAL